MFPMCFPIVCANVGAAETSLESPAIASYWADAPSAYTLRLIREPQPCVFDTSRGQRRLNAGGRLQLRLPPPAGSDRHRRIGQERPEPRARGRDDPRLTP